MEGPFYGPSEHKVAALLDVIVFDCCCTRVPVDLGAFKISYGKNAPIPTDVNEDTQKPVRIPTHTCSDTGTHTHSHMPSFAFQKSIIAQGGDRGSVASGFPESACEVNES